MRLAFKNWRKGKANASVPLLIISAKAAKDACKTNGCFINPENCEKLNLPFSVDTKLSLTNFATRNELIANSTATKINTNSTLERAAMARSEERRVGKEHMS